MLKHDISHTCAVNSEAIIYYRKVSLKLFFYLRASRCSRTI